MTVQVVLAGQAGESFQTGHSWVASSTGMTLSRCTFVTNYSQTIKSYLCWVSLQDFIIGGDLNAGCRYVCDSCWDEIELRQDSRFNWVIGDDVVTTTGSSQCPYDRWG